MVTELSDISQIFYTGVEVGKKLCNQTNSVEIPQDKPVTEDNN